MFLENSTQKGWIEVVCGSMFSGKTEELIRRLRRAEFAHQRVEIFKPQIDVRYSEDEVVSHNHSSIRSTPVESPQQILLMSSEVDVVGVDEAQFQLGFKGLIDLAWRSGEVADIQAHVVYENDKFEYEYGLEPKLKHIPATGEKGDAIAVYAIFRTKNGGFGFEVMSMDDVRAHAERYSKAYNYSSSPWKTNFEEMAKKTVLKKVLKYAPLKSEFVKAVVQDESIKTEIAEDMYEVQNENVFEADYTEVDTETGEVTE